MADDWQEISNFTSGELSPRMLGRFDLEQYANGCAALENFVVMPQGGVTRRPGTMFVQAAGDQSNPVRLLPFVFNELQPYVIEICAASSGTNGFARFYQDDGIITSGASPVVLNGLPYLASELAAIKYCQSADTLYLCHPAHPPATITRSSNTAWSYQALTFRDGPYLPTLEGALPSLTVSGASFAAAATVTVVLGATTNVNGGQGFLSTDVGRMLRIQNVALVGWAIIATVTSTTAATAVVQNAVQYGAQGGLDGASPVTALSWLLGAWSATTGYPAVPVFFQNRLGFLGGNAQPNGVNFSVAGDFTNFSPSDSSGTVTAANALSWVISDDQVNAITAAAPAGSAIAQQIGLFTSGKEHILQPATTAQALSATNVQVYPETQYGSTADVRIERVGKSVLFFDRSGRRLREWTFTWQVNGYIGPDITVISEHITGPGIAQMAYAAAPYGVLWCVRSDGVLIGLTYMRDQSVVAWHRHRLGGQYYGGQPIVETLTVVPSPDGTYDELWLSVLRTIGGAPTRMIEVMTRYPLTTTLIDDMWFLDAALATAATTPAATVTANGLALGTGTGPAWGTPAVYGGTGTLTATASVFTSAQIGAVVRINGGALKITGYTSGTEVDVAAWQPLASLAPAPAGAWQLYALDSSVSGLGYLDGETAQIVADGAVLTPQVVAAGAVSLSTPGNQVVVGLHCPATLVPDPFRSAAGMSQIGKQKRIDELYVRLFQSSGGRIGRRFVDPETAVVTDYADPLPARDVGQPMDIAPPPFSGTLRAIPEGGADREGLPLLVQDQPLPMTVLALVTRAPVQGAAP